MLLVAKANVSSHFRPTTKKPSNIPKSHQLAARLFEEKIVSHMKTLDLPPDLSNISLSWLSAAVSFLSTVHSEAEVQISNLKSEADDYQAWYMDYSLKVLDLCNLISSAVRRLTDLRLLMNFSLRLLNLSDQIPSPEKLNKAKDALARFINNTEEHAKEKGFRAKTLIEELTVLIGKLPRDNRNGEKDLLRRTFYTIGVLTVFVGSVLVTLLFGETDVVNFRVPAEFVWANSVDDVQNRIIDMMKLKQNAAILEVDNVAKQAVVVRDLIQVIVSSGDADGVTAHSMVGVTEMATAAKKFSDGVDALTDEINGIFRTVLKIRNSPLDI